MFTWIKRLLDRIREMRGTRIAETVNGFKARYHAFRALLDHNERALELVTEIENTLATPRNIQPNLADLIEELERATFEMVDGLNILAEGQDPDLFLRHQRLTDLIRAELDQTPPQADTLPYCLRLDEITPAMKPFVGGKASGLADLKRAGLPVPEGFVVTWPGLRDLLRANDLELRLNHRLRRLATAEPSWEGLTETAGEVAREIMAAELPAALEQALQGAFAHLARLAGAERPAFSVRSSAVVEDRAEHSFAGQFKTVLNVTSWPALVSAIKEVQAGAFTPRALTYRWHHGLPLAAFDMAVLCQVMVPAQAAGVLFTLDPVRPESQRMLLSAVPGLGTLAVSGEAPADVYQPARNDPRDVVMKIAQKTWREVCRPEGGLAREPVPEESGKQPVLNADQIQTLVHYGLMAEAMAGAPQDLEWALSPEGRIYVLQSRPQQPSGAVWKAFESVQGRLIWQRGVTASSGRALGRVRIIRSPKDLESWPPDPVIAFMPQSLVEAARWLPRLQGLVVDLGNPTDHLSVVAREGHRPMIVGAGPASRNVTEGQWIILDADRTAIFEAPADLPREAPSGWTAPLPAEPEPRPALTPALERLRQLIVPLHLTDAYGANFSILECRSLHDLIRYVHEMAIMAMFHAGDTLLEEAEGALHRLDSGMPFGFFLMDVGGGLVSGLDHMKIRLDDVLSVPFLALWRGMTTPGLRWGTAPAATNLSGLFTRGLLNQGGPRPIGSFNYALVASDYLNLNARVDFHFAMIDTVCGGNDRENHLRFRFKGGGTSIRQRERRINFLVEVLLAHGFTTDARQDLVTAAVVVANQTFIEERLTMLGRLLGFSRLLDAAMGDDEAPRKLSRAFLEGDYGMERI